MDFYFFGGGVSLTARILSLLLLPVQLLFALDSRQSIAVGDFEANGLSAADASILVDRLRAELINAGVYRVMERSQMDAILKEQAFQESGACNTSECQVKIGQLLSVDHMVVGSIGLLTGNLYSISARVLNVETGEIESATTADYQGSVTGLLTETVPQIARKISGTGEISVPGDLFISTSQPGATISIDGIPVDGVSPLELHQIPAGKHQIQAVLGAYTGTVDTLLPSAGVLQLNIPLVPKPGSLQVASQPTGATVTLDNAPLGTTPLTAESPVGTFLLGVSAPGYFPKQHQISVQSDSLTVITDTLEAGYHLALTLEPNDALLLLGEDTIRAWSGSLLVHKGPLLLKVNRENYAPYEELLNMTQDLSRSITLKKNTSFKRKLAYALLGSGALCAGTGWYFNSKGDGYMDDYENAGDRTAGETAYDNLQDADKYRNISYVAMGVALVSGVALWILSIGD
ncbi:MAG TPA: PEGA domain-containing protein [Fibrobacteraceae bacterium]|nr:PEGA domain-containing protein [Fibrobacteraceae bacterium]